jgi:glycosylphosphatidylinositol transamidase (GPIT) subunit GPI8
MTAIKSTAHFAVLETSKGFEVKYRHTNGVWSLYQTLENRELALGSIDDLEESLGWDKRLQEMVGVK